MAYKYTSYFVDKNSNSFVPVSIGYSYDDFKDIPIKNVYGSSINDFVILSQLQIGRYNLKGYFRYDPYLELYNTGNSYYDVNICYDDKTGNKVAVFKTMEDGIQFTNTITYDNQNRVQSTSHYINGLYWEDF